MKLNFKLLEGGILPTRAHNADAGFDLYSPVTLTATSCTYLN